MPWTARCAGPRTTAVLPALPTRPESPRQSVLLSLAVPRVGVEPALPADIMFRVVLDCGASTIVFVHLCIPLVAEKALLIRVAVSDGELPRHRAPQSLEANDRASGGAAERQPTHGRSEMRKEEQNGRYKGVWALGADRNGAAGSPRPPRYRCQLGATHGYGVYLVPDRRPRTVRAFRVTTTTVVVDDCGIPMGRAG